MGIPALLALALCAALCTSPAAAGRRVLAPVAPPDGPLPTLPPANASLAPESFPYDVRFLRCAYGQDSVVSAHCDERLREPSYEPLTNCTKAWGKPRVNNTCGLRWLPKEEVLRGIPEVHIVGDSTLLRLFRHMSNATDEEYDERVRLTSQSSVTLDWGGTKTEVFFWRTLHIATTRQNITNIIRGARPRALVLIAFGPHDTSWLVFRRAMPGYNRRKVGDWPTAQRYWDNMVAHMSGTIYSALSGMPRAQRPFVVFREHFYPNCRHIKYSKYPLLTRCPDMLRPRVVPFYRNVLAGAMGTLNIPVVGIDAMMPPCVLIDAGHVSRWCKDLELQFAVQAYRLAAANNVEQAASNKALLKVFSGYHNWPLVVSEMQALPVVPMPRPAVEPRLPSAEPNATARALLLRLGREDRAASDLADAAAKRYLALRSATAAPTHSTVSTVAPASQSLGGSPQPAAATTPVPSTVAVTAPPTDPADPAATLGPEWMPGDDGAYRSAADTSTSSLVPLAVVAALVAVPFCLVLRSRRAASSAG